MKWITRDHVHMDRVASAWLIRRFIDPNAEFSFVAFVGPHCTPSGAIGFSIEGSEIGPHDADGSTFRKLLLKYKIKDAALELMTAIIESGIYHVMNHQSPGYQPASLDQPEGIGLDAISLGMMYVAREDGQNIEISLVLYEALYSYCRLTLLRQQMPHLGRLPFPQQWDRCGEELAARQSLDGRAIEVTAGNSV